jgi:hypothetical protein
MKKKSTSQLAGHIVPRLRDEGGFLNLRVLFGLFVMLAGIFLALLSFGTFSRVFAQNGITREQMTLTLAQALGAFQPPACVAGSEMFNDVPADNPFCPFIEELSRRGITGGCGGGNFCPRDPVTRQQMAVFLVKLSGEAFHIVGAAGEPPFQNGWTNFGRGYSQAGFFKDGLGFVHLKGALSATTNGLTVFTLPLGYRPAENLAGPGGWNILQDGQVLVACGGAGCSFGLDGVAFRLP